MQIYKLENVALQHLKTFYLQRVERLQAITIEDITAQFSCSLQMIGTNDASALVAYMIEHYLSSFENDIQAFARNPEFCLNVFRNKSKFNRQRWIYEEQLANAQNRLTREFIRRFCATDFKIDWKKLFKLITPK